MGSAVVLMIPLITPPQAEGLGGGAHPPSTSALFVAADTTPDSTTGHTWTVGDRISLPRADILKIEVRRTGWGWVETAWEPGQLKALYDRLRVSLPGSRIELKEWEASADSLYGEVVRIAGPRFSGGMIPRTPPTPVVADPVESPKPSRGGDCFRAQACPKCDSVFLLEFAVGSSSERCGVGGFFSGGIGMLRNLSSRYGLGATLFYEGDDCGGRFGIRPRLRIWLAEQVGLDFAPGVILGEDGDVSPGRFPSFSGQIALDCGGLIAPFYQVDLLRDRNRTRSDSFAGLRMESYAAPLAAGILVLLAAATWNQ